MNASRVLPLARRWAGALLVLLAAGWLAPAAARAAGCAHDGRSGPADPAHFDRLIAAGALAATPDRPPAGPTDRPQPCSGAFCSRNPLAPPTSAASAAGPMPQWLCLGESPRLPTSDSSRLPGDARLAPTAPVGPAVFHPPRPA